MSTTHSNVTGPDGEQIGTYRLSQLTEQARSTCFDGVDESANLLICNDLDNGVRFQRVFEPLDDGADAVLTGMAYYPARPDAMD